MKPKKPILFKTVQQILYLGIWIRAQKTKCSIQRQNGKLKIAAPLTRLVAKSAIVSLLNVNVAIVVSPINRH